MDMYELFHAGVAHDDNPPGRGSGRYGWGTGDNPYQHQYNFLSEIRRMSKLGMSQREIAIALLGPDPVTGELPTSGDLRKARAIADDYVYKCNYEKLVKLYDEMDGNLSAVARKMTESDPTGKVWRDTTLRHMLEDTVADRRTRYSNTADFLKKKVDEVGIIDVGGNSEINMGVTKNVKDVAIAMLEEQGYVRASIHIKQMGTGNYTDTYVLAPKGMSYDEIMKEVKAGNIHAVVDYTPDDGKTWWVPESPTSVDSKRVFVRYGDEGGTAKDGVIELRPGVEDISLGGSQYAQVRIAVDGTHYMKGMAIYSDEIPDGYDIVYNTNKKSGTPVLGDKDNSVMKLMKNDPDNPFGANLKMPKSEVDYDSGDEDSATITAGGQRHYIDQNGIEQLSPVNKLREEGDWEKWSKTISAQFLSKQPLKVINQQLDATIDDKRSELDSIKALTNSVVKKHFLNEFADSCDANAADLKSNGFKDQAFQVILPVSNMKDTECYAPNFSDGEKIALVRYPHAGQFEIPILTNNTRQSDAKKIMNKAQDAIGINQTVAEQLSGADFDGDTVVAIPIGSTNVGIQNMKPLVELQNFDPKMYKLPSSAPEVTGRTKQTQMGIVTNLITDMTVGGADIQDVVKAVKHSMVVIDSEKHHLDWKQSARDNEIQKLREKYQKHDDIMTGKESMGAATILSRARKEIELPKFNEITATYKMTPEELKRWNNGDKVYRQVENPKHIVTQLKDPSKMTSEQLQLYNAGKKVWVDTGKPKTTSIKSMYMVDDARDLVRDKNNQKEMAYANYANNLKDLAREARKEARSIEPYKVNKDAKQEYASEVKSIQSKLTIALSNAPNERVANAIAGARAYQKKRDNPDMDAEHRKKLDGQMLIRARAEVGAKKTPVSISDKEWEAIQAKAVSATTVQQLMNNTNKDRLKKLATPRGETTTLSSAKIAQLIAMGRDSRYTQKEIAEQLGVSVSTVSYYLRNNK